MSEKKGDTTPPPAPSMLAISLLALCLSGSVATDPAASMNLQVQTQPTNFEPDASLQVQFQPANFEGVEPLLKMIEPTNVRELQDFKRRRQQKTTTATSTVTSTATTTPASTSTRTFTTTECDDCNFDSDEHGFVIFPHWYNASICDYGVLVEMSDCTCLVSIVIPRWAGVTTLNTFKGCTSLAHIIIPDTVTEIWPEAFYGCISLTSVAIPTSVTDIGQSTFYGCSSLTSVTISASVTEIKALTFYGCSSLTSVTIPTSVTYIGVSAFEGCSSLTSVVIPASVRHIEDMAFRGCTSLTLVLPSTISISTRESCRWTNCENNTFLYIGREVFCFDDNDPDSPRDLSFRTIGPKAIVWSDGRKHPKLDINCWPTLSSGMVMVIVVGSLVGVGMLSVAVNFLIIKKRANYSVQRAAFQHNDDDDDDDDY